MDIFYWDFMHHLEKVQKMIQKNEIIAGETDTVIGLFGNCTKEAFDALNSIKRRDKKPYIILVSSRKKAVLFVESAWQDSFLVLAALFWPGPYTIVVKANPAFLYAASDTKEIALRVPDSAEIRLFLAPFQGVFSTSANVSGEAIPQSLEDINPDIKKAISGYIMFKKPPKQVPPSTIIQLHENKQISMLRGSLSHQQEEMLKKNGFFIGK